jgi:hypothetical protein
MSCDTPGGIHVSSRQLVDIVPPCGEHWLATMPIMQLSQASTLSVGKGVPFILPLKPIIIQQLHHGAYNTRPQPQLLTMELTEVAGQWRFDIQYYAACEVVSRHLRRRMVYRARVTPGACNGCRVGVVGLLNGSCVGAFCGYGLCRDCPGSQWKCVSSTPDAAAVCAMVGWLCREGGTRRVSRGRDINNNAFLKPPKVNVSAGGCVNKKSNICQGILNADLGNVRGLSVGVQATSSRFDVWPILYRGGSVRLSHILYPSICSLVRLNLVLGRCGQQHWKSPRATAAAVVWLFVIFQVARCWVSRPVVCVCVGGGCGRCVHVERSCGQCILVVFVHGLDVAHVTLWVCCTPSQRPFD